MRLLSRLLLTVMSFLLIITVLWLSLPRLIVSVTHSQLSHLGYGDIVFEIGNISFQSATIEHLSMSNDEFSIELQDLKVEYRFSDLLSGAVDSIVLEHAELTRLANNKSSSALPDPLLLLALLRTPWDEYMLAHSLRINNLSLFDESGYLLLRSSFDIDKQDRDLRGKINFVDNKNDNHLVSLEVSAENGIFLRLHSETAAESAASPLSISLKPADEMNGLAGQINIDLSKLTWMLAGTDILSGHLQADISYLSSADKAKKDFSVVAEISDVQYESLLVKSSSINILGRIEALNDGHRIDFAESSSILAQSFKKDSYKIEKLHMILPQTMEVVAGQLSIPENNGASISLEKLMLDEINIPELQLRKVVFSAQQSSKEQLSCKYKLQLIAPIMSRAGLDIKTLPVQLDGACPESENEGWSIYADTASLVVEDEDFILPLNQCHAELGNRVSKKNSQQDTPEFSGKLSCESSKQSSTVLSTFQFSTETGAGHAKYSVAGINPNDELPLFASVMKNWKEPYDLVAGNLLVKGSYRWWKNEKGQDRENMLMNFNITGGGGYYESALFSGLDYSDQIEVLPFVKSSNFADLNISDIDVGIPITSTTARILYSRSRKGPLPVITINSLNATLLDGKVLGNDLHVDLNNEKHELILVASGLDISEIIELQQIEGLSATGRLDGYVPVTITEKGLKITEGKIVAQQQGGQINYRPEGGTLEMEKSAVGSEFVFRIIEDLKYDSLNIDVNYQENGELDMKLAIKGKSPKVDENRPVHFNLNLQQNVLKLLEGLRYAEGLSDEIDKNVQKHFSGD